VFDDHSFPPAIISFVWVIFVTIDDLKAGTGKEAKGD